MPGLVPGTHVLPKIPNDVDGRDKPGHDDVEKNEHKASFVPTLSP